MLVLMLVPGGAVAVEKPPSFRTPAAASAETTPETAIASAAY